MKRSLIFLPPLTVALLLSPVGCSKKTAHEAEHEHEQEQASAPEGEGIPLEGIRGLRLMQVPEARQEGRWVPGEAMGDEGAQAVLASPVKGIVARLLAAPGQAKAPGTPLALIQSPELARLKAEWMAAKARLERAQAELVREERLFAAGAGARRDLEAAKSEAATVQAEEEAARLGLEAVGLKPAEAGSTFTLKSPAAGSVVAWKIQQGQGVEAGQELGSFQVAQAAILRVELPQPGPGAWKPGALSEVRSAEGRNWKARLEGVPTTVSPETQRLVYRLRLLGGPLPMPGAPVEVKVPLQMGLFLPQAALQQVEGRWGVFVVEQGKTVHFRPVARGLELQSEVLVLEGLKPGETLVAEGAYLLKAYQQKRSQPEGEGGHGH
jgi:cobalt-zinc-cadmium efflux system membrane fusion protein